MVGNEESEKSFMNDGHGRTWNKIGMTYVKVKHSI
jgi:hypothetical protein